MAISEEGNGSEKAQHKARAWGLINKINTLRKDYALLTEQEKKIVQLIVVEENTANCISRAKEQSIAIEDLGKDASVDIPGYSELTDFSVFREDYLNNVRIASEGFIESAKETCKLIDNLKGEVAGDIYNCKAQLGNIYSYYHGDSYFADVPFADYLELGL